MSDFVAGLVCGVAGAILLVTLCVRFAVQRSWIHTAANCRKAKDIE